MQRDLLNYFKKSDGYKLPSAWTSGPLPAKPVPRAVGRPRKRPCLSMSSDQSASSSSATDKSGTSTSSSEPVLSTSSLAVRGKYRAYSVLEKQAIVSEAREQGIRVTASNRRIAVSTLAGWMRGNFGGITSKTKKGARCQGGGRKVAIGADSDDVILKWILEQRELHVPVSRHMIQDFARRECSSLLPDFVASDGWLRKFMRRHELSLRCRTSTAQKLPADLEEKVSSFLNFVKNERLEDEYENKYIVNMDETPVFFDLVPNRTVEQTGKKSMVIRTSGSDKRHVTVILAVAANGEVLPTVIIFKGKRALKDIKSRDDIIVMVQEKAWVDESVMLRWIDDCLHQYTQRNRTLLVLDSFRCHIKDSVKKRLRKANSQMAVIPGNFLLHCRVVNVSRLPYQYINTIDDV